MGEYYPELRAEGDSIMAEEYKHKSFTLSVNLLLTIVLIINILIGLAFGFLHRDISVLQEKVSLLEDHDIQMEKLKQKLFVDMLEHKGGR